MNSPVVIPGVRRIVNLLKHTKNKQEKWLEISQSCQDEIFRVFQQKHPEIELIPYNENSEVKRMIKTVKRN
jgi:hypothetical protein